MSTLTNTFSLIANAIRQKTGGSNTYTPAQMPQAILNIPTGIDTSDATATAEDIAEGKTAYVNGSKLVGTASAGLDNSYGVMFNDYDGIQRTCFKIDQTGLTCSHMFYNQSTFNAPVTIGNNVTNCYQMFVRCDNFNQPVTIPDNVASCGNMFSKCTNFNAPVTIGNNVNSCWCMFSYSSKFNQPINIPNKVIGCSYMFQNCTNFNQSVIIPEKVNNCMSMFANCLKLNQPVTIGNNVNQCSYMFKSCTNLNQPVTIGNKASTLSYMFDDCTKFNQPVTIPVSAIYCMGMFRNCTSFGQSIFIKGTVSRGIRLDSIFNNCNVSLRKNIYFNSALNAKITSNSLVGEEITWTSMTNGFYNSVYNIYCYYNYSG